MKAPVIFTRNAVPSRTSRRVALPKQRRTFLPRYPWLFTLSLCWIALFTPRIVHAQQFYIADGTGLFGILDLPAATFQQIGTTPTLLDNLGFAPDGTLYALGGDDLTDQHLYKINPATAALTDLGGTGHFTPGAAVGPDGLIYSIDGNTNELIKIDPKTLAVTSMGIVTVNDHGSTFSRFGGYYGLLAFSPQGTLYVGELRDGFPGTGFTTLDSIDLQTAVATTTTDGGAGFGFYSAGTFVGNTLYAFGAFEAQIINPATGVGKRFGPIFNLPYGDEGFIVGVAAVTPEPGMLALLLSLSVMGVAGILRRRRRSISNFQSQARPLILE